MTTGHILIMIESGKWVLQFTILDLCVCLKMSNGKKAAAQSWWLTRGTETTSGLEGKSAHAGAVSLGLGRGWPSKTT